MHPYMVYITFRIAHCKERWWCWCYFKGKFPAIGEHATQIQIIRSYNCIIEIGQKSDVVVCIYRPPDTRPLEFIDEFNSLLEELTILQDQIVICGDFNIHLESSTNPFTSKFCDLLECFALKQRVRSATHVSGHMLDCIITRQDDPLPLNLTIDPLFSDHFAIFLEIPFALARIGKKTVTFRKLRDINLDTFRGDLKVCVSSIDVNENLSELVDAYNISVASLLDIHAPVTTKNVPVKPYRPWFDDACENARKKRRRLERRWKKTE